MLKTFKKVKVFGTVMAAALTIASMPISAFASPVLQDGGVYIITSRLCGKAMEVVNQSMYDGAGIDQWDVWYGDNQKWRATQLDSYGQLYRFINVKSGKALEVAGGANGRGVQLQQWGWWGGDNQKWLLYFDSRTTKHSFYHMTNAGTNLSADVSGFATHNGAAIIQWSWLNEDNQSWAFTQVG
jgi:hypothetical protein